MMSLNTIRASLHDIAIKDSTNGYELSIDSNGYITSKINGSITVTASDLDIRDLSSVTDSVSAVQSGTWNIGTVSTVTAVTDITNVVSVDDNGGSLTVDATNLDIRDLTSASDSVEIKTAAGQALAIDGSGYLTANINGTVTVSATNLDVRDLTHVSDSIKIGDGTDLLAVNADGSINVQGTLTTTSGGYASWLVTAASVDTTVGGTELVSTPLTGRIGVMIQNLSKETVWLRDQTGVTSSNGIALYGGGSYAEVLDATANIFAIANAGTCSLRIAEYAA